MVKGEGKWRERSNARNVSTQKLRLGKEEELEAKLGFDLFAEGEKRLGWLLTLSSSTWDDQDTNKLYSYVDLFFVSQDGSTFKCKYRFSPYFYAATKKNMERDVEEYLRRRYEGQISEIELANKEYLDLRNHLSGLQKPYLKISFDTVQQLMHVKSDILHIVERNCARGDAADAYESIFTGKRG